MPLDEVEFSPSDGLWDLVGEAAELAPPSGVIVVSERDGLAVEPCGSVEAARERAHALLEHAWRAAVVWRDGLRVLIEAQDAETDTLAGRFVVTAGGEPEFPSPIPPLRAPTWNGTTWTLRVGERIVAELKVTATAWHFLLADVTPLPGLDEVLPESPYRATPVGAWSLHQPDGTRVEARQLELNRDHAGWTWKGAFGRDD